MTKRFLILSAVALVLVGVGCQKRPETKSTSESSPASGSATPSKIRMGSGRDLSAIEPGSGSATAGELSDDSAQAFEGGEAGSLVADTSATLSLPPLGAKVIQNADLDVRVGKGSFQKQFDEARQIAQKHGGFVTSTSISETDGKVASGHITLRVPADKFDAALDDMHSLGKVTRENQSGQDVTEEFVDLEARLRHAKSEESFYLKLMSEAKSVSDLLQIRQQLSQVQLQIEELTGRLEYLKNQTSFSTVSARIFEAGLEPSKPKKGLAKAWQEAIDGFKSVVMGAIVGLGWIAPFAILGIAAAAAFRTFRKRAGEENRTPV